MRIKDAVNTWLKTISPDGTPPTKGQLEQPYIPEIDLKLLGTTEEILAASFLLGMNHVVRKVEAADSEEIPSIPFSEAVNFIKSKIPVTKQEWNDLEPKLRFRAFTVSRLAELDYINVARELLSAAIENGESYADYYEHVKDLTNDNTLQLKPGHWENVYRTNTQTAYTAGKLLQCQKTNPAAYQLFVIEDSRTSDICRHLLLESGHGITMPANHKFWTKYGFPPYHYQCRTCFRPIYKFQIGKEVNVDNPSMKSFSKFKPLDGFGGNPVEKDSWWKMTDSMVKHAEKYGVFNDIEEVAKENGLFNFAMNLVKGSDTRRLENTQYYAKKATLAKPLQKEINASKILEENGHSVYFTPVNTSKNIKNPDAIIDGQTADFKTITSTNIEKIGKRISECDEQKVQIACLEIPRTLNKQAVITKAKKTLEKKMDFVKKVYLIFDNNINIIE